LQANKKAVKTSSVRAQGIGFVKVPKSARAAPVKK
jgi:hypothetical protein